MIMARGTGRREAGETRQADRSDDTHEAERPHMEQTPTPTDTIRTTDIITVEVFKPRTVMFNRGTVRHVALHKPSPIRFNDTYRTLCDRRYSA